MVIAIEQRNEPRMVYYSNNILDKSLNSFSCGERTFDTAKFGSGAADLTHRLEDVTEELKPETGDEFWPVLESRLGQSSAPKKVAYPVSYGTRALLAEREWVVEMEAIEALERSYSRMPFCYRP